MACGTSTGFRVRCLGLAKSTTNQTVSQTSTVSNPSPCCANLLSVRMSQRVGGMSTLGDAVASSVILTNITSKALRLLLVLLPLPLLLALVPLLPLLLLLRPRLIPLFLFLQRSLLSPSSSPHASHLSPTQYCDDDEKHCLCCCWFAVA